VTGTNEVLGGGGFHHVAMRVADFDATVNFYKDILGFREFRAWGQGDKRAIMMDTGDGGCLEVFAGGPKADDGNAKGGGVMTHFCLRTDDIDATVERIRQAGAEITVEPKNVDIPSDPILPVRLAFFKGPAGEIVELVKVRS
jgi:glyoxylase I family protein